MIPLQAALQQLQCTRTPLHHSRVTQGKSVGFQTVGVAPALDVLCTMMVTWLCAAAAAAGMGRTSGMA
jgi:hypothetical protein